MKWQVASSALIQGSSSCLYIWKLSSNTSDSAVMHARLVSKIL